MNKSVKEWNERMIISPNTFDIIDGILKKGDDLVAEIERLESALKEISECSDLKEIYRIARGK